jgi:hypothetical protein
MGEIPSTNGVLPYFLQFPRVFKKGIDPKGLVFDSRVYT